MQRKLTLPPPELVELHFEEAERYWKEATVAREQAERAAYEDMARQRIDLIRHALH